MIQEILWGSIAFLFHAIILAGDVYFIYDTFAHLRPGIKMLNALTVWGLILHAVYFLMAVVMDIVNAFNKRPLAFYHTSLSRNGLLVGKSAQAVHTLPGRSMLEQHRDRCFGLSFAVSNLIGLLFWSLLFPGMQGTVLLWDLWTHAATWIAVWVELFLVRHVFRWKRIDIPVLVLFCGIYLTVNLVYHSETGIWWYPFQATLGAAAYAVYIAMIVLAVIFYYIARILTFYYWRAIGRSCICCTGPEPLDDGTYLPLSIDH